MARPRVPQVVAKATAAAAKNPKRFRERRSPGGLAPLGEPPSWFDQFQKRAWASFKRELPWLNESNRALLELASLLRAQIYVKRGLPGLQGMQELRRILGQLGATPADASKVQFGDGDEEDPDEELFKPAGRPN